MYGVVEEAKRCTTGHEEMARPTMLLELDMHTHMDLAQALRDLDTGDRQLEEVEEQQRPDMGLVWLCLDKYRQAVALSRGHDVEIMCVAYTKIARVYLKVMGDPISRSKGKDYLKDVMELSKVIGYERNLHSMDWFKLAASLLKEIQDESQKKEDEEWTNKRKVFVEQLSDELKMLKEHEDDDHEDLVIFLFDKMPPKHRPEGEWKHMLQEGQENGWKKCLMKLVTVYHPDRVDKATHTDKYHVLCEEITKELTKRYNQLKM